MEEQVNVEAVHKEIVYKVYDELKKHVGAENAISANELCGILYLGDINIESGGFMPNKRALRTIIREIRRSPELEKVPCSSSKGYYIASTKEEAERAMERIMNGAKDQFKTYWTMAKKFSLNGQMKIKFDEYMKDTYYSIMENEDEDETDTEAR